jgi:hypothetical protein
MPGPGWKAAVEATLRIAPGAARASGSTRCGKLGQRADVEVDHLALPLERQLGEPAGEAEAGIVDQRVDVEAARLDLARSAARGARARRDRRR